MLRLQQQIERRAAPVARPSKPVGTFSGPAGNSRLTGLAALPLLVLLAAEGLSLQSFLKWHVFLGMLLVPLIVLKLASTGLVRSSR